MPRMMGAAAYDGLFCHCCNQSRAHHHQRQRERQQWRRTEWQQADASQFANALTEDS